MIFVSFASSIFVCFLLGVKKYSLAHSSNFYTASVCVLQMWISSTNPQAMLWWSLRLKGICSLSCTIRLTKLLYIMSLLGFRGWGFRVYGLWFSFVHSFFCNQFQRMMSNTLHSPAKSWLLCILVLLVYTPEWMPWERHWPWYLMGRRSSRQGKTLSLPVFLKHLRVWNSHSY